MQHQKERLRRSVTLEPQAKLDVNELQEVKGISANRVIEQALRFQTLCVRVASRENGEIVGLVIQRADGECKTVYVIAS